MIRSWFLTRPRASYLSTRLGTYSPLLSKKRETIQEKQIWSPRLTHTQKRQLPTPTLSGSKQTPSILNQTTKCISLEIPPVVSIPGKHTNGKCRPVHARQEPEPRVSHTRRRGHAIPPRHQFRSCLVSISSSPSALCQVAHATTQHRSSIVRALLHSPPAAAPKSPPGNGPMHRGRFIRHIPETVVTKSLNGYQSAFRARGKPKGPLRGHVDIQSMPTTGRDLCATTSRA